MTTMQVRMLTREQLRACGWEGEAALHRAGVGGWITACTLREIAGRSFSTDTPWLSGWRPASGGNELLPEMCNVGRVKTREQLLAEGWQEQNGDLYPPTNSGESCFIPCMYQFFGSYIPLDDFCDGGRPYVRFNNYSWTRGMFEDSPTVQLCFGELPAALEDARPAHEREGWCGYARVKTEQEFEESGWERYGGGNYHKTGPVCEYMERPELVGTIIPVVAQISVWGRYYYQHPARPLGTNFAPEMLAVIGTYEECEAAPVVGTLPEVEPVSLASPVPRGRTVRAEILAFRDALPEAARELITCGFELETQESEGTTYRGSEDHIDEDRANEDIDAQVAEMCAGDMTLRRLWDNRCSYWPKWLNSRGMTYAKFETVMSTLGITSLDEMRDKDLISQEAYNNTRDNVHEYITDNWDFTDYRISGRTDLETKMPDRVQVGSDGSVRGFEFRTEGALTYQEFTGAAEGLFKLDHEIDTGCSFHVHLAVKGVKHRHGDTMQKALTEYLIEHQARVPASVLTRWRGIRDNTYIQPGVKEDKYSFVFKHGQGTWEFRCFGNVQNAEDGKVCLDLAIEALQYAYRVTTGQARLYSEQAGFTGGAQQWAQLCLNTLATNQTVTGYLAERPAA